ncbi:hypothetical protein ABI59_13660 [Acidobacteria bacterium Mor1]|nr:hypothetical protein ABI59_13660 [Acidobacteria bacterium Mor1]
MAKLRSGQGVWRSRLIVGLLSAAILLVGILALQAAYAYRFHRQVAESVLRDYAQVIADEFIRRTSVEIGYRGYFAALTELEQRLDPDLPVLPQPGELQAAPLLRTLILVDGAGELAVTGEPLEERIASWLLASIRDEPAAEDGSRPAVRVLHDGEGERQRSFVVAPLGRSAGDKTWTIGFEVNLESLQPRFEAMVADSPLLPASLGDGELSNELLSIRLNDVAGAPVFVHGRSSDPMLATYTPFGDTYSGMFEGMTLLTSIDPSAASRLVIGGLPRSRLPVLGTLLVLTVGLLLAAIAQLRRERALAQMRAEFVSRVSHELRTPLTQIRLFAETLLLGRDRNDEERQRSLEIIDQESRRLSLLVENVLQFSRGDRGAIRLAPERVDLAPMLREVIERFMPIARARRVTVAADLEDSVVCNADVDAMTQVVLNLLDNAVKYGPADQEVRLGAEIDGSHARIWVEDQGPGIPAAERERIWRRWQRLPRDERSAVAGSGIGLTLVRDLIALHGGRVSVEDGARGGARFVVELPREA